MTKQYKSFVIDGKTASKIVIDNKEVSKIVDYNTGDVLYEGIQYPPSTSGWDWHGKNYTISSAGRWFARYSDVSGNPDVGTVMSMNDGTDRNILVLDAQYRIYDKQYYIDDTTNLNDKQPLLDLCTTHSNGISKNTTDSLFANTSYANQDTKTSYYNTQKLVDYNSTNAQAAAYCREKIVNGTGCDLPNINVLCRIYAESAMLDSLDPTVSSYSSYSLETWKFGNKNTLCVSSSWYGKDNNYYFCTFIRNDGYLSEYWHSYTYGVCPILEL